jgi:sporulation protein YlmC with PRC-barrel domain
MIGSKIVSADQRHIGHVVDVEVSISQGYRVTALIFGRYGWLSRLRVLHQAIEQLGISLKPHRIPWCGVARIESGMVILRHGLVARR